MAGQHVLLWCARLRQVPRDLVAKIWIGYIIWEYPTNRLLQRLPLAKYSSFNIIMWGGVLACLAGVKNFEGALAVRFFLGVFEAAVTPGFALFTSQVRLSILRAIGTLTLYSGILRKNKAPGSASGSVSMAGRRFSAVLLPMGSLAGPACTGPPLHPGRLCSSSRDS